MSARETTESKKNMPNSLPDNEQDALSTHQVRVFAEWLDGRLAELEERHSDYITHQSLKCALAR